MILQTVSSLTLYTISGSAIWSGRSEEGSVRPDVQPGIYVAAWQPTDGLLKTFKYMAK